jgi:hypothetical protein
MILNQVCCLARGAEAIPLQIQHTGQPLKTRTILTDEVYKHTREQTATRIYQQKQEAMNLDSHKYCRHRTNQICSVEV